MIHSRLPLLALALAAFTVSAADPAITRLPTVTSASTSLGLAEDRPADATGRPEWTSARRFPGTRVYIQ